MTGRIPPYGRHFTLEQLSWTPNGLAQRAYVLKADPAWFIRSDRTSGHWRIYHGWHRDTATPMGRVQDTFSAAMDLLLDGIEGDFYTISEHNGQGK